MPKACTWHPEDHRLHAVSPPVICIETLASGSRQEIEEIPAFMATEDYIVRGATFVNTIFVDGKLL